MSYVLQSGSLRWNSFGHLSCYTNFAKTKGEYSAVCDSSWYKSLKVSGPTQVSGYKVKAAFSVLGSMWAFSLILTNGAKLVKLEKNNFVRGYKFIAPALMYRLIYLLIQLYDLNDQTEWCARALFLLFMCLVFIVSILRDRRCRFKHDLSCYTSLFEDVSQLVRFSLQLPRVTCLKMKKKGS